MTQLLKILLSDYKLQNSNLYNFQICRKFIEKFIDIYSFTFHQRNPSNLSLYIALRVTLLIFQELVYTIISDCSP